MATLTIRNANHLPLVSTHTHTHTHLFPLHTFPTLPPCTHHTLHTLHPPQLISEIQRLGSCNSSGQYEVTFGRLAGETPGAFEALSDTLDAARKLKVGWLVNESVSGDGRGWTGMEGEELKLGVCW